IVGWSGGASRMALLASWRALGLAAGVAAVSVIAVTAAGFRLGSRVTENVATIAAPFALLWLWAVPYLPWLPDRAPLLLVFAGPIRWVIAGVVTGRVLARLGLFRFAHGLPQIGRRSVFAISLALYVGLGLHAVRTIGLSGDEPH